MSRRPRPRRRRREEAPVEAVEAAVASDLEQVPLHQWIDPRAVLALADSEPAKTRGDDRARLAWYREHHPHLVHSEAEVRAQIEHLERMRRYQDARREARLRGLPAPDLADFGPTP